MKKKRVRKFNSTDTVVSKDNSQHECRNCSTEVEGNFCHFCGQRYHDHKESFGELVYEFASDFLHFDSRFFRTILPLLFSPGKLTRSYNEGKQRSQFHPIRLYLFSSFVYFFLFFYFNHAEENFKSSTNKHLADFSIDSAMNAIQKDSLQFEFDEKYDSILQNTAISSVHSSDAKTGKRKFVALSDSGFQYTLTITPFIDSLLNKKITPEQYKEFQKKLSKEKKAGYFERIITIRLLKINIEGEAGRVEFFKKVLEKFIHNIPKMLFFLLPVFALLLKLLYLRRKQFYYVDHAILSLHYFSFIFLLLILSNYILDKLFGTSFFTSVATIWIMLYLLLAMKKLYAQSWAITILKYLSLGLLFLITVIFTLIVNMAFSAFFI